MPSPNLVFRANTVPQTTETNMGKMSLSTTNAKYILIYNRLRASSSSGCTDFVINIYKNGTLAFSQRLGATSTTAVSYMESPLDLTVEFGGSILVTVINTINANHSFIAELIGA
jgi:hypothetical protein